MYREVCLMEQPFVKNPDLTISDLLKDKIATIGENIVIRRFTRYQMVKDLKKNRKILRKKLQSRFPILKKEGTILCLFRMTSMAGELNESKI